MNPDPIRSETLQLTVEIGGENCIEPRIIIRNLIDVLDLVEVVGKLPGNGAVEPRLEIGGPVLGQHILAPGVPFADAGNARVHGLPAVHVLHGDLAEEEVHIVADLVGADKVRLVQVVGVVLEGALEGVLPTSFKRKVIDS